MSSKFEEAEGLREMFDIHLREELSEVPGLAEKLDQAMADGSVPELDLSPDAIRHA